ncbi:unnamed protein product [Rhizophagus irregularis]|nr:unnamed protein product [Rhizophagus irregularis]CAB4429037.1 unnamed protein product [Rhizophagus irregularis]
MRYLHTSRLNRWPKKPKTSDLKIALDYYSGNAIDNTGWIFTISCAFPLLFNHHLEIHLEESHINPEDLPYAALQKMIPGLGRGDSSSLVTLRLVLLSDFTVYPKATKIKS